MSELIKYNPNGQWSLEKAKDEDEAYIREHKAQVKAQEKREAKKKAEPPKKPNRMELARRAAKEESQKRAADKRMKELAKDPQKRMMAHKFELDRLRAHQAKEADAKSESKSAPKRDVPPVKEFKPGDAGFKERADAALKKGQEKDDYASTKVDEHWAANAHPSWRQIRGGDHPHGASMRQEQEDHVDHFKATGKLKPISSYYKKPVPETEMDRKAREKADKHYVKEHARKVKSQKMQKGYELIKYNEHGQWSLEKAVYEEDPSSMHTDRSINPALGGKYGKVHGGDPRKGDKITRDQVIEGKDGKYRKRVSGASRLRSEHAESKKPIKQEDLQYVKDAGGY
jgi:hypothetical protein